MAKPLIRIDITSDILCPFCWIGKKCVEKAMASRKEAANFEVRWHPFFLRRGVPDEGIDKLEAYGEKFGMEQARAMLLNPNNRIATMGREFGIAFNYRQGCVVGDSSKGHRLLWHVLDAHGPKKQDDLMEVIFRRYFDENLNIGDVSVMVGAAEEVGITAQEARDVLEGPAYRKELDDADRLNHRRHITGVPHFDITLAGDASTTLTSSGAQPPEHFASLFDRLLTSA